ncbi:PTS system cellobiose-specific IIA component [Clostridium saccharoperbutylacetonicum]|uniref:Phosphotransferase system cellobiose-specific component IIA n=1 Tax=Clostridium saccharoperbutylacetonicum N1-4(HMT) TaxID=931276 RepID=M1N0C2_9CLOT|nr:PTS lactose/cellobiose transporter subunit IIA [Clostridium saccharoperbutylacetonicum]AGF57027.1 phosphotransferase system cellobiose-specific component IIA [Clostridium saccharoperbutylacetonicum N1-4(HMT)]NRT62214.1 PTS system cellobiose-specific IIA component [Clostridium saccharoperbutylacetonicum]NSB25545.1 PTS system cellobiose-specific IIA component [Clostridium saccharoperbutylacetonicum]NSB44915.1 PTS system cellobiose-specific IIA component [Clostridium saccharoperbutylacetonicum]
MSELEMIIMNIIINAGEAKAHAYDALEKVNDEMYEEADALMQKASESLELAHNAQTSLLQKEAAGEKTEITVLFVHAQDHLMTALTEKNLIEQIVKLRKIINTLVAK